MEDDRLIPRDDFFYELGITVFQAQALDDVLVTLFASLHFPEADTHEAVRSIMDAKYRQTLGKIIRDLSHKIDIPEEIKNELEVALAKRNWVVHHFFREYGLAALSDEAQDEAISRLRECRETFDILCAHVYYQARAQMFKSGDSEAAISQDQERIYREFTEKYSSERKG
jgi:hypothetical protein